MWPEEAPPPRASAPRAALASCRNVSRRAAASRARAMEPASGSIRYTNASRWVHAKSRSSSRIRSAASRSPSVTTTQPSPALAMSACGNPVKRLAARAPPSASIARARAWSSRFGKSPLPCRITWGSIGRFPHTATGRASPRSIAKIGRAARIPVSW